MAVRHGPDDVLRPERRVAAEEYFRIGRLVRHRIDDRHVPLVEFKADVALDPGESILLTDGDEHVIALHQDVRFAGRYQLAPALGIFLGLDLFEQHAAELAVLVLECLGHHIVVDRDVLMHRVFFFPGRGLHLLETRTDDDLDVLAAQTPRGAAAVHRGVAAAENNDALADAGGMAERDGRQPVDADMDVFGRFLAAGNVEIAAARRAAADEDRVVILLEQRLQAIDALAEFRLRLKRQDVAALLVQHAFGQAEFGNLRAHHAAGERIGVVDGDVITERQKIARHGQRCRSGTDQRDALAVLGGRRLWHAAADIVLRVGANALQTTDRNRFFLDAAAPAGRLTRTVAGSAQNAWKDVRFPVDHVGVGIAAGRNQADIFRHRRVRRARPLAIHHFVEVVRIGYVGRRHTGSARRRGRRSPFSRDTHVMLLISKTTRRPPNDCEVPWLKSGALIRASARHFPLFFSLVREIAGATHARSLW